VARRVLPTAMEPQWPQSTFAGRKAQTKEGLLGTEAHFAHILFDGGVTANVNRAIPDQPLEDLLSGVGVLFQP
jgi:hypothetical protein